jgi:hypothetical protein
MNVKCLPTFVPCEVSLSSWYNNSFTGVLLPWRWWQQVDLRRCRRSTQLHTSYRTPGDINRQNEVPKTDSSLICAILGFYAAYSGRSVNDVSGQPIGPIFKGCLEDGIDRTDTLPRIPEGYVAAEV